MLRGTAQAISLTALRHTFLAGGALIAGLAGAATPAMEPAGLSTRDAAQVAEVACAGTGSQGADRVDASKQRGSRTLLVTVECKPHATAQSLPVARHSTCDNAQGTWRCDPGRDALLIDMPDQRTLPVLPEGVAAATAIEIVREAAKLTIRPFYRPAARVMKGKCSVSEARTTSSEGMISFHIRCGETLIVLTKDCWDGRCRYFIPFAQNY